MFYGRREKARSQAGPSPAAPVDTAARTIVPRGDPAHEWTNEQLDAWGRTHGITLPSGRLKQPKVDAALDHLYPDRGRDPQQAAEDEVAEATRNYVDGSEADT